MAGIGIHVALHGSGRLYSHCPFELSISVIAIPCMHSSCVIIFKKMYSHAVHRHAIIVYIIFADRWLEDWMSVEEWRVIGSIHRAREIKARLDGREMTVNSPTTAVAT